MTFNFTGDELQTTEVTGSDGEKYELREATKDVAIRYQEMTLKNFGMVDGKVSSKSLEALARAEIFLVGECLFKDGKKVGQGPLQGWKNAHVKKMYEWVKEVSELNEEEETIESLEKQAKEIEEKIAKLKEDSAGNEQSDTTD